MSLAKRLTYTDREGLRLLRSLGLPLRPEMPAQQWQTADLGVETRRRPPELIPEPAPV